MTEDEENLDNDNQNSSSSSDNIEDVAKDIFGTFEVE